jgi:hypothetical protein
LTLPETILNWLKSIFTSWIFFEGVKVRKPERYPYENAIEDLAKEHFGLHWSFDAVRSLPNDKHSKALMAIRTLVYEAMQKSFNAGIGFQKSGKTGMRPA